MHSSPTCRAMMVGSSNRISAVKRGSRGVMPGRKLRKDCCVGRASRKKKGLIVRSEMGGEYEESFDDVAKHITDLFTYKAVRLVLDQLRETDPISYKWLYEFTVEHKPSNSFAYCKLLVKDNYALGERILLARLNLLADWTQKIPSQREKMILNLRDTNLEILRGLVQDSVNLDFTAKPRPDVNE